MASQATPLGTILNPANNTAPNIALNSIRSSTTTQSSILTRPNSNASSNIISSSSTSNSPYQGVGGYNSSLKSTPDNSTVGISEGYNNPTAGSNVLANGTGNNNSTATARAFGSNDCPLKNLAGYDILMTKKGCLYFERAFDRE